MVTAPKDTATKTPTPRGTLPDALSFDDVAGDAIPASAAVKPNPFDAPVKALADAWDDDNDRSAGAKRVTVPSASVSVAKSQLARAGKGINRTVRIKLDDAGNGNTSITFWLRPRIVHGAKGETGTSATTANA